MFLQLSFTRFSGEKRLELGLVIRAFDRSLQVHIFGRFGLVKVHVFGVVLCWELI